MKDKFIPTIQVGNKIKMCRVPDSFAMVKVKNLPTEEALPRCASIIACPNILVELKV